MKLRGRPGARPARPVRLVESAGFLEAVAQSGLVFDPAQQSAIRQLGSPCRGGCYLWGPAGRGKTLLADLYYASLTDPFKRRFHFHEFFRGLQSDLAATRAPVELSIERMLGSARAVLFDEFHAHDVADALYLTTALRTLVDRGILLLATSNYPPEGLLPDPLHHHRFAPAIGLIQSQLRVIALGAGHDYRRVSMDLPHAQGFSAGSWNIRASRPPEPPSEITLEINGLVLRAVSAGGGAAVFTFGQLCGRAYGVREYLWLAEHYTSIRVTSVPDLAEGEREELLRFGNLVDVLYDRNVRLDVDAATVPARVLAAKEPPRDVARTLSRLATLAMRRNCPVPEACPLP